MKEKYWDWLTKELRMAWKMIKIVPFAFWDFFKWIGSSIKEVTLNEVASCFTWENLCVISGACSCLLFMGGLILTSITSWVQDLQIGLLVVSTFLISTYAYWRGKPDE